METQTLVNKFYEEVLNIAPEWKVTGVGKDTAGKAVCIAVEYTGGEYRCPVCGEVSKPYDHRIRRLRHLDTRDYQTIVEVTVPRVRCPKHKVQQMAVPFAEKHSVYTELFENKVIEMLKTMTTKAAAKQAGIGWDAADNIKRRAVQRGLGRREKRGVSHLGIDETSYRKGHDYITVITDKESGNVLDVLDGRDAGTVEGWFKGQDIAYFGFLESISMDMSGSYLKAAQGVFPEWERQVCYDRFHLAQLINRALDSVRRKEYAELERSGEENPLRKKRYGFLINSGKVDNRKRKRRKFMEVTKLNLKTSLAWRIKEAASLLWDYEYMGAAKKNWESLLWWIAHSKIPEMIRVGKTIRSHLWGILNAIRLKATNAAAESTNNIIQGYKRMAFGFRNKERFKTDILFRLGGLDLAIHSP